MGIIRLSCICSSKVVATDILNITQIVAENELRDTVFCVTFDGGNW